MTDLADRNCVPCRGGVPPLDPAEVAQLAPQLPAWQVVENHHLTREFRFPDFAAALAFVNRVGALAEQVDHHPEIRLGWGRVGVDIWTHKIDGLTETDFVFAARVDRLGPSAASTDPAPDRF